MIKVIFPPPLQQQRPDLPRILQQVHAQQLPPGAAMGPHPGIPGLPGLGPGAGLPVPTSASAALLGLGIPPGAAATAGGTAAHPLSMLTKPDLHRGQPDDLKHNGGKSYLSPFRRLYIVYVEFMWQALNINENVRIIYRLCLFMEILLTDWMINFFHN